MAQHLSIRIPWKDNGYAGLVCDKPCYNNACLRLKSISDARNDDFEESLKGCPIAGHEKEIPCTSEGAVFMAETTHSKTTVHPYKESNPNTHGHFLETELVYPPFSLPARPFGWMMLSKGKYAKADTHKIDYDQKWEPLLPFATNWVQEAANQKAIFKTFYQNVVPNKSLVIVYAKQVPFIEDAKRVVMGLGFVDSVIEPPEHKHNEKGRLRSLLWETMIGHTIRDNRENGFLLPYREMMEYAAVNPDFDIGAVTVFAEDDYFAEFSYATEHLSYDAVISVLLQTLKALNVIKDCIPGNWRECINWTTERLKEVWLDRGAFPGLGAMLCAFGFKYGLQIVSALKASLPDNYTEDGFWRQLDERIAADTEIDGARKAAWRGLPPGRKKLFRLLSRFSFSTDENIYISGKGDNRIYKSIAAVLFDEDTRRRKGIACSDDDILGNPYILYEKTRLLEDGLKVSIKKVDMAVYPDARIAERFPLPRPSALDSDIDKRRVRALTVSVLEELANNGHTFYPRTLLVEKINALPIEPVCPLNSDILASEEIKNFFAGEIHGFICEYSGQKEPSFQLLRLFQFDELIRRSVDRRVNSANRHTIAENWDAMVAEAFPNSNDDPLERQSHDEKIAVLKELAAARLSVLLGGAGTGKTTLLSILCGSPAVQNGGILLLAPTGKARVRITQTMQNRGLRFNALTVAQFLLKSRRYNIFTGRYSLSNEGATDVPATVIVDESSMLTTEMFGALLEALRPAQRIIFAGDPNQLPPIGAGKPFVDLVQHLNQNIPGFPKVGKSYGELTIGRRQRPDKNGVRTDAQFAQWFVRNTEDADENIFTKIQSNACGAHLALKTWKTNEELERLILETVAQEAGMKDVDDINGFNTSLGGVSENGNFKFDTDTVTNEDLSSKLEEWQILAPIKGQPQGVQNINHIVHTKYRQDNIRLSKNSFDEVSKRKKYREFHAPVGAEGIVYGDKVMNVRNDKRDPNKNGAEPGTLNGKEAMNYIANGEVGLDISPRGNPKAMKITFSSQPGFSYGFPVSVNEEGEAALELAYALTVHKAQGSQFKKVILVIAEPCRLLSTEMLYTALTRQTGRVVILYNAEAYKLRNYSLPSYSDIVRRFTCLFVECPKIVKHAKGWYDENLIHRTIRGDLVRSKSEVIIANMLHDAGIAYEYEKTLDLGEDGLKSPDFTMEDAESGTLFYWEHCGMMSNDQYRKRWEEKKAVYEKHGIIEGENLIVSYDDDNGSIDSIAIKALIEKYLK